MTLDIKNINWKKGNGLVPAIVQDASTEQVLMLGYMNAESLKKTQETGLVTFYSRSRKTLWTKGETSGNTLKYISIACLLYTSPSPRDATLSRMPSSA